MRAGSDIYKPYISCEKGGYKMFKRVFWATLLGVLFGIFCAWGSKNSGYDMTREMWAGIIMNRALIGFAIGISRWRIQYMLHGVIVGFIITLGLSIYPLFAKPISINGFLMLSIAGIVYGFLIELLTTKVFRAPMR
ncbi:MAG: hypothetical protein B6D57_01575 [Candidatus Coatesbacteria bacterium 4484_99]|uniref:Uncharacterized protein n=1 Tax=Candidatus Coatesbacteria bacterium 4484_99 TaxID=1970774 RepID=A0A1W9S2N0_9BACT|nr:MAG: hypothetical protein B6D57_01575 [Candidatus Coatesbacteria bacterium 4484_99]